MRTIYNPVPIYMGDKPGALAVDYGVAYFTLESREEAAADSGYDPHPCAFEGDFTRGLYFKGDELTLPRLVPSAMSSSPEGAEKDKNETRLYYGTDHRKI